MAFENNWGSYLDWVFVCELFWLDLTAQANYSNLALFACHVADNVGLGRKEDLADLFANNVLYAILELIKGVFLNEIYRKCRLKFTFYHNPGVTYKALDNFLARNIYVIVPNLVSFFWLFTNHFNETSCLIHSNNFILILEKSPCFD